MLKTELAGIKALTFDVFGTVVDWPGSIAREVRALAREKGLRVNAAKFADAWRAGYRPALDRVRSSGNTAARLCVRRNRRKKLERH